MRVSTKMTISEAVGKSALVSSPAFTFSWFASVASSLS